MKSKIRRTSLGTAALALAIVATPVLRAKDTTHPSDNKTNKAVVAAQDKMGQHADDIIGQDVRSSTGEDLGEVQDLLVDTNEGRIAYALISTGGILGIGDTVHVLPFSAFSSGAVTDHALTVDLKGKDWKMSPTVRQNEIAGLGSDQRGSMIYDFYGRDWNKDMPKATSSSANGSLWKVSDLTGRQVRSNGQNVGEIEDVIVNFAQGRASALLDPNDDYTGTDKKFAIAFSKLTPSADKDVFTTTLQRADFSKATPLPEDWTSMTTGYPYIWGYGVGFTTVPMQTGNDHNRKSVAEVRRMLRNDSSLGNDVKNIQVRRHNDQLVLRGQVRSEDVKEKLGDKAGSLAKGWDLQNQLTVRSAAE
ncbi:MAG: PRC-barrel domain-containing protein [Opitutus sp.]